MTKIGNEMNNEKRLKIESEVLKKLIAHLQKRTDVQNIDLMNLSGFCRNCLSRWYSEAANENGVELNKDDAKEIIYGMPHSVWKDKYQTEASEDQKNKFKNKETETH
jgi:hypothetical protein